MAVGVAEGADLVVSKVDTRYVQGRTAAGGWSQHRFARRRDNQAKAALGDAADLAVRLLLPEAATLAALVCGGDRRAVDTVLADRRLAPLVPLRAERLLDVPEPGTRCWSRRWPRPGRCGSWCATRTDLGLRPASGGETIATQNGGPRRAARLAAGGWARGVSG